MVRAELLYSTPEMQVRISWLDFARGVAVLAMVAYHAYFNLVWWRVLKVSVFPWWLSILAVGVAVVFVGISGVSTWLQVNQSGRGAAYWRRRKWWYRLTALLGGAAAVSLATWWVEPSLMVSWGVLHFLTAISILMVVLQRWRIQPWLVAACLGWWSWVLADLNASHLVLQAVGIGQPNQSTFDYFPLWPWMLVFLSGWQLAAWGGLQRMNRLMWLQMLVDTRLGKWCQWCGRHALAIYLLHQPVMWAVFLLQSQL